MLLCGYTAPARREDEIFRGDHPPADNGGFWALWRTLEWPFSVRDTYMLWCREETRLLGDNPAFLESPGGYIQKDGKVSKVRD